MKMTTNTTIITTAPKFIDICNLVPNCDGCPCAQDCMNGKCCSVNTADYWKTAITNTIAMLNGVLDTLNGMDAGT